MLRRRAITAAPEELDGAPGGPRVGQVDLGPGRGERPDLPVPVLGVGGGADHGDHDRLRHGRERRGEQRGRVGLGAVAEHHVEQEHADLGVGRRPGELLEPQRRVDHRVRPAAGVLVVAEVDEGVPGIRRPAISAASWHSVPPTNSPRTVVEVRGAPATSLEPPASSARRGRAGSAPSRRRR